MLLLTKYTFLKKMAAVRYEKEIDASFLFLSLRVLITEYYTTDRLFLVFWGVQELQSS